MSKTEYAEKLQDPRWQRRRLELLDSRNWTCELCKDKDTSLHVHHLKYTGEPWEAPLEDLQSLCKHCHELVSMYKDENYLFHWSRKHFYDPKKKLGILALDFSSKGNHLVVIVHINDGRVDTKNFVTMHLDAFKTISNG